MVRRERALAQFPSVKAELWAGRLSPCQVDELLPILVRGANIERWTEFAMKASCLDVKRWREQLCVLTDGEFESWKDRAPLPYDRPRKARDIQASREVALAGLTGLRAMERGCHGWELSGRCHLVTLQPVATAQSVLALMFEDQMLALGCGPTWTDIRLSFEPDALAVVRAAEVAVQLQAPEYLDRGSRLFEIVRAFVEAYRDGSGLSGQRKRLLERDGFT
jgi:hypothetical protein